MYSYHMRIVLEAILDGRITGDEGWNSQCCIIMQETN